jgi:UDP-glucose 4-epimerase
MRYLVVGGRGYLGSHLVEQLIARSHEVYIFDNHSGNLKLQNDEKVTCIHGDLTKVADLEQLKFQPNFDGVFHLAAKKSVSESIVNPKLYEDVNILGTQNLINYCRESKIPHIVFTSSAAVYGQSDSKEPISETSPTNPMNPYGNTKLRAERVLETSSSLGNVSAFSLRVFNIVGASRPDFFDHTGENVIPIMLRSLSLNNIFTIFGKDLHTSDGTCIRDYVNVSDVASAHINAMEHLHNSLLGSYKVVNVSAGTGTSMLSLVEMFNSLSDKELRWQYGDKRPGDPASIIGGNQLAYDILGWKPQKELFQSVKESLASIGGN